MMQDKDMTISDKHNFFLYPIVRVFSKSAAGSGTVIYSQPDSKNPEEYITLIMTNFHVIEKLITHKKEWDGIVHREVEKEFKEFAKVETFDYIRESQVDSSNRYDAEIVAYDKNEDLAILRIDSPRQFKHVAEILPEDKIKELRLFMEVVVAGCSLAHEPFCNFGQLTFLKEIIEQKQYFMTNASSIFGNSGGALFLRDTGHMIGVPSRISAIQLGFGVDVVTWMGFSAHTSRLYEFFRNQELNFVFDSTDDYHKAMDRREKRKKQAMVDLKAELMRGEEQPTPPARSA